MNTNFKEDELVSRKLNGQTRVFPVVGGRLRLAHEENETLSPQTRMVSWDKQYAVFRCTAVTTKGEFVGYGTANSQRDARLADSLVELAETRSIARALRFAGYGLEYTGAEEVSHVAGEETTIYRFLWLYTKPKPKPKKRTVESELRRLINERNFWRNRTCELRGGRRGR